MNWDQVKGNWKQFKGEIKERWGKLTDDDLDVIEGRKDQLLGLIQKRYGLAKEEAEDQLSRYLRTHEDLEDVEKDEEEARLHRN